MYYRQLIAPGYYLNARTIAYSLAFISWGVWAKHIDWMALHGINLPLASVAREAVVLRVFMDGYGLTFAEIQEYLAGPAFLPVR